MMPIQHFPEMIQGLPEAQIPIEGIRGWILQSPDHQLLFLDIEPTVKIPPHSHGEQWGIVVEGEMELKIGESTNIYRTGDSYHIPAGIEHAATFLTRVRAIDFFADKIRYRPK